MNTLQIGDLWLHEEEGGLARYYYELLRHLPGTDTHSIGLVVGSNQVAATSNGTVQPFAKTTDTLLRRMLKLRAAALARLRTESIDLIASHFAPYMFPLVDRLQSYPTVVHFHGPWGEESSSQNSHLGHSRAKSAIERIVYSRARRLIVLSKSFQQELIERYDVSEDRVRIIPGGIDIQRFNTSLTRSEARTRLGWPTNRPIILAVRRQVPRMGLEELIDAAALLVQRCPDVLLILGGTGPLAADLATRIHNRGLERNVRLAGRIKDEELPLAYRAADMSVVPSNSLEGFGLITLESLASGTPVYVTPVGGLPEIIQPFAPDCVFANTSAAEMSNVLYESLRGTRKRPSDIDCRNYAVDHFSWDRIATRVRGIYDEAIA